MPRSGSPIINAKGAAVAVLCASEGVLCTDGTMEPMLTQYLPPWLLAELITAQEQRTDDLIKAAKGLGKSRI